MLAARGEHPGLVHVIAAMEACESYRPWHDKPSGKTYLRPDSGKCLHYYFYFIDEARGLCYLRVPTWCPFRLQFYWNGHSWLARPHPAPKCRSATGSSMPITLAPICRSLTLTARCPAAGVAQVKFFRWRIVLSSGPVAASGGSPTSISASSDITALRCVLV